MGDPLDEILARQNAEKLRAAMTQGMAQDPEAWARNQKVGNQLGVSPTLVATDPSFYKQAASVNTFDYANYVRNFPRTSSWASVPDNAAVSHDDLDKLAEVERAANGIGTIRALTPGERFYSEWLDTPVRKLQSYPLTRMGIGVAAGTIGMAGNVAGFFGDHGSGPTGRNLFQRVAHSMDPSISGADTILGSEHNALDTVAQQGGPLVLAALASGGTSAAVQALGVSARVGTIAGGLTTGAVFTADQGGAAYTNALLSGKTPEEARHDANVVAGINALPNTLMGLTHLSPFLAKNPLTTSLGTGAVIGTTSKVAENIVSGKPTFEGVPEAALHSAAFMGGLHMGMGMVGEFGSIVQAAGESKLRARNENAFRSAIGEILDGSGAENVRIAPDAMEAYFQSKGLDAESEVARVLGKGDAEAGRAEAQRLLQEARATGNDVVLPSDGFLAHIDPEHQSALLPDIRLQDGQPTAREYDTWVKGGGPEKVKAMTSEVDAETAGSTEYQAVKSELRRRYIDAGESPEIADNYATLQANVYANLARESGLTPTELMAHYDPKVVAGEAPVAPSPSERILQPGASHDLATGLQKVPEPAGRTGSGALEASGAQTQERGRGPGQLGEEPVRLATLPENAKLHAYQLRNAPVLSINGVDVTAGPRPPYFSFHGNQGVDGKVNLSTSPTNVAGDGVYLTNSHEVASAKAHTGESGQTLSTYVDTRRLVPLDARVDRTYTPEEAKALGVDADGPISGQELLAHLNDIHGAGTGFTEAVKKLGFNAVSYSYTSQEHPAWSIFDPSIFKRTVDTKGWTPEEIARREAFDPSPVGQRPNAADSLYQIPVDRAKSIEIPVALPSSTEFSDAVAGTPGARVTEDGLVINLQRFQHPDQGGEQSVRTAVFYLPDGAKQAKYYKGAKARYGGTEKISGETLLKAPIFVKGATGGKVPEIAYDSIKGKGAYEAMRSDVLSSTGYGARDKVEAVSGLLEKYGADPDLAYEITRVAKMVGGNNLAYAVQENIVAHAAREAGHDSIVGYSKGKEGAFISEVVDLREDYYPTVDGDYSVHPVFLQQPEGSQARGWFRVLSDGTFEIGKTKIGDLSTFVHEPAHSYLFMMNDLIKREGASDVLKGDHEKIREFLGWDGESNLTREQHETWARANEAYLREGKAPSEGLRGVFQRFSVWLSSIYRKAVDLGVELSPEIRDVFDRLYATEEGVNKAHEEIAGPDFFKSTEEAGWTPEQIHEHAIARGIELEKAKEEILAKMNAAVLRDKTQEWRDEEASTREAVTLQVDASPEYQAIRALRMGVTEDGIPMTLNREALVKQFGEERVKALHEKHPSLYRKEGGIDADTAAELMGYDSAEQMMQAVENAPKRADAINERTRQVMTDKHGDIRYDGTLDDQARMAVVSEDRAKSLASEISALQKKLSSMKDDGKSDQAGKRMAATPIPMKAFRDAAIETVSGKPIFQLDPNAYMNAMRKHSREAINQMKKGDYLAAIDAKKKEMLNQFMFLEATKTKAESDNIYSYAQKLNKPKSRERMAQAGGEQGQHVYLDQVDQIFETYEFARATNKDLRSRQSLDAWVAEYADDGAAIDPAALPRPKNYRELTITELRAVKDALRNIEVVSRNQLGFIRNGVRTTFEAQAGLFDATARQNLREKPLPRAGTKLGIGERTSGRLRGMDAEMQKMEWLVDMLDKGDINGPARENIKRPIDEANGRFNEMSHDIFTKLQKLEDERPAEDKKALWDSTGIQFPKMDRPLNRFQLISWALNLGNIENRNVALNGEGLVGLDGVTLKPEFEQAVKAIRPSEWKWIQGVWDTLGGMTQATKEKALRTTGIEPKWKERTPFSVMTDSGEKVDLKGGYYPLKADPIDPTGRRQQDPSEKEAFGLAKPTTSTSHLKEVTGATYRLMMDYQHVLSQHLTDVIKDTTSGEAIHQVYKFVSNKSVYQTLQETMGNEYAKEFLPWLQDFAVNKRGSMNDHSWILNFLMSRRTGMVAARLGGNMMSYLVQMGDIFKPMADPDFQMGLPGMSRGHLAKAFLDIRMDPAKMIEEIRQLSPNEMRFREENFNREIKEMLNPGDHIFEEKRAAVTNFLMQGFGVMDRFMTFPTWLARYRQGMAEHGVQEQAVREADRLVGRSFQAGDARNMSKMMRQEGWMKLVTTFQGDANTWYGILSSSVQSGNAQRMSVAILALVAEQLATQMIRNRPPAKDENTAAWTAEQVLLAGLTKIPMIGDLAQFGIDKAHGRMTDLQNPTMQAIAKAVEAPIHAWDKIKKGETQSAAIDTTEAVGLWTGIPGTAQAVRAWKYLHKVQTGEERPSSTGEMIVNAVTGKPKEKK